jgi:ferredoxin
MKVNVDNNRCEGHAVCVAQAPDAFELDDDGHLHYRFEGQELPAGVETAVRAAVDACPVAALSEAR